MSSLSFSREVWAGNSYLHPPQQVWVTCVVILAHVSMATADAPGVFNAVLSCFCPLDYCQVLFLLKLMT